MSEPVTKHHAVHTLAASPEISIKPKVLRRPPALTPLHPPAEILSLDEVKIDYLVRDMAETSAPSPAASVVRWQQDGRFGIVLLVILLCVNTLSVLLLSRADSPRIETNRPPEVSAPISASSADSFNVLDDHSSVIVE